MVEYPIGAVQHIDELKVGDKIYSITLPHDAGDSNAVSNTKNLVPYLIESLNENNAMLITLTKPEKRANITISYRNINPYPYQPLEFDPEVRLWFLFKNYWHAYAYYLRFIDQQSMKTT